MDRRVYIALVYIAFVITVTGTDHHTNPKNKEKSQDCIICFEELKEEATTVLKCNHKFHADCIHKWVHNKVDKTCPTCRDVITNLNSPEEINAWSKKGCMFKQWVKLRKKIDSTKKMTLWRENFRLNRYNRSAHGCFCLMFYVGLWPILFLILNVYKIATKLAIPLITLASFWTLVNMIWSFVIGGLFPRTISVGSFTLSLICGLFLLLKYYMCPRIQASSILVGVMMMLNLVVAGTVACFEFSTEEWMYSLST